MTADTHQERPSRSELGRALMAGGVLTSDWATAFAAVPRAAFLPELMWPFDMASGKSVPVSRTDDPITWYRHADADEPIVTQWDDGRHGGREPGQVSTSSASMPSVVFAMLRDLDVSAGHRVLEIGTGTGWNAALLAHRVGPSVWTVEVDGAVADAARAALNAFGSPAQVVHGDGFKGWPDAAPYDRIMATCGLRSVPPSWVAQCRPGGVIVAPWGTHYSHSDAVARLVVAEDGRSASGPFTGGVQFMKLRSQRQPEVVHSEYVTGSVADGDETSTPVTEEEFVSGQFSAHQFALALRMRDCVQIAAERRDGARPVWLYSLSDRSWACVMFRDGDTARVWQYGLRRLWDEAETAHRWWREHREPEHTRFGLTVTPEGQWAWLDGPEQSWRIS